MKTRTWLIGVLGAALIPLIPALVFSEGRIACARLLHDHGPDSLRGFAFWCLETEGLRAAPEIWDLLASAASEDEKKRRVEALRAMTLRAVRAGSGALDGAQLAGLVSGVDDARVHTRALDLVLLAEPEFRVASSPLAPKDLERAREMLANWFASEEDLEEAERLAGTLLGCGDHPRVFRRALIHVTRGRASPAVRDLIRDGLRRAEEAGPGALESWAASVDEAHNIGSWWARASGAPGLFQDLEDLRRRAEFDRIIAARRPELLDHRRDEVRLGFTRLVARSSAPLPNSARELLLHPLAREDRFETEAMLAAHLAAGLACRPDFAEESRARIRRGLASTNAYARENATRSLSVFKKLGEAHPDPKIRARVTQALSLEGGKR